MAKKAQSAVTTTEKVAKVKLSDKIEALKAQAESGDMVVAGAMGALDQLLANQEESKAEFKTANKRLRNFVNALSK